MKKLFSIITITAVVAVVMSACKGGNSTKAVSYEDTVGFAQFQSWKAMNERTDANAAYATTNSSVRKTSSVNKSAEISLSEI